MKQITKLKAFTLSEIIIVLILTSIVVALAFSVLSLIQKHMFSIQQNYNNNSVLNKFETSLWLDFNRYNTIKFNALENELHFTTALDSVIYKFNNNYITKDQDTFKLALKSKSFYFVANQVDNGAIDAVKIETTKALQNQQLFIFKQNDASVFLK